MMMHMISCCKSMIRILPYGRFLTKVFKDVGIDLSRETYFEVPNTYDTYDDQSMAKMKFEKVLDGSWVRKAERAPTQALGQGQAHLEVEKKAEIREVEGRVDPQSGYRQREPELDILPLQSKGVQFEATFSKSMMFQPTYIAGPSTQLSFIDSSFGPKFTEIPPPQEPLASNHTPWMDLFAQISSLGNHMEELIVVSDTQFYSMEDCMDQYQAGFTSQFDHLQQRIERIEDRLESQHEEMMAYLLSVFPPPPSQP